MSRLNKITNKIEKVEKLLKDIKSEIEQYELEKNKGVRKNIKKSKSETIPSREKLIDEYNKLYQSFLSGDSKEVFSFVESKTINYLKEFCKANNISIVSGRQSKQKISDELVRWFQQRKAISKRNQ
ncbi:hypothetical protein DRQ00_05680 [candidate division KSB1 bacterium]|nr:MAG: hypothetical protein DRQ00_05680 [candidate division KSB1 bacterium]